MELMDIIANYRYGIGIMSLFGICFAVWWITRSLLISAVVTTLYSIPAWMIGVLPPQDGHYPPFFTMVLSVAILVYLFVRLFCDEVENIDND